MQNLCKYMQILIQYILKTSKVLHLLRLSNCSKYELLLTVRFIHLMPQGIFLVHNHFIQSVSIYIAVESPYFFIWSIFKY